MKEYKVSYETVGFLVDSLLSQLESKDLKFNYVVGIGRGGLIPATLIGYRLDLPVLNFGMSTYNDQQQLENVNIYQDIDFTKLKPDSNILVVDDICDTGNTFTVFSKLHKPTVKNYIYVSLFAKKRSALNVHFYGSIASDSKWVSFPW